jgi:hypothetical protein
MNQNLNESKRESSTNLTKKHSGLLSLSFNKYLPNEIKGFAGNQSAKRKSGPIEAIEFSKLRRYNSTSSCNVTGEIVKAGELNHVEIKEDAIFPCDSEHQV